MDPRLVLGSGPHAGLRRTLFVVRGIRRPDHVEIEIFSVE